jgi:hypothetical protein
MADLPAAVVVVVVAVEELVHLEVGVEAVRLRC